MGTANGMIRAARGLLGEHEHPMGSNYVPDITGWYNDRFHIGTTRFAWCDASVTKEADESGNADAVTGGRGFAYVPAHAGWFRAHGRFHSGTHGMRPGDVVFYNWSGRKGTTECDHVGLCERDLGGSWYVLEGNHNDAFQRVWRDSTYISGYGRPAYAANSPEVDMPLTNDDVQHLLHTPVDRHGVTVGAGLEAAWDTKRSLAELAKKLDALAAAVAALKGKGA